MAACRCLRSCRSLIRGDNGSTLSNLILHSTTPASYPTSWGFFGLNSMTIPGSRNAVLWSYAIQHYRSESGGRVGRVLIVHFGVACDPPHSVAGAVHRLIALPLHSAVLKTVKLLQDTAKAWGQLLKRKCSLRGRFRVLQ